MADITDAQGAPRARAGATRAGRDTSLAGGVRGRKPRTLWSDAWRQYRKHKLAMIGTFILIFMALLVTLGPLVYRQSPTEKNILLAGQGPSLQHPLGLNQNLGQDMLARVMDGGRKSLLVGLMAIAISISVGTLMGAFAGFFGGKVDTILMRITDLFIALPTLPLLLLITFLYKGKMTARFGTEIGTLLLIVLVIGALSWMSVARLVRASFLSLKEKEFVEAARSIGAQQGSLIFKHILPNVLSPVIVAATLGVGAAIIQESTLSFLGLGFPPDVPTWGSMLQSGRDQIENAWHVPIFPGLAIFLTVLSINYIGDGLRDALDPRSRQ